MMRTLVLLVGIFLSMPFMHAQDNLFPKKQAAKTAASRYIGLDMVELVGGTGENTDNGRLAMHWKVGDYRIFKNNLSFSVAGSYAIYDLAAKNDQARRKLRDVGLTPTAIYRFKNGFLGLRPFMEAGIGFHYLTEKQVSEKTFSTHFQFGDHFSVGVEFGRRRDYRINYQFQHLSNGGIDSPNPGINFHLLSFGARLH